MNRQLTRYKKGAAVLCFFLISAALTFGGCNTKGADSEQETAPITVTGEMEQEQTITEEQEQQTESVTVTRAIYGTDIAITAHPIQVKDGIAALELEYKLIGEVDPMLRDDVGLYLILDEGGERFAPDNMRLIDFESKVVYTVLLRADNPRLFSTGRFAKVDEDATYAANSLSKKSPVARSITLFAAPENKSVTVFVPNLGLISEVPVVQAGADSDFESYIKVTGEPSLDTIEQRKSIFREYLEDYGEEIAVKKEGTEFTVTISSDVLFDTDKYDLNPEAEAAIDRAVEIIKASHDGGTVTVVGHTDDVDTHEYNQTLSENRAETVGAVMKQSLGASFAIETLGKGETEPILEGTTAEARAANRRVDITFKGKTEEEESTVTVTNTEIPTTEMPIGSGNEWLEFSHGKTTYRVKALRIIRTEGVLIGYFAFGTVSYGEEATSASLMGAITDYPNSDLYKRGYQLTDPLTGAHSMSLLTSEGRLFSYDYSRTGENNRGEEVTWSRLLGDDRMYIGSTSDQGETPTLLVTVIWPDTGQDKVTVDVETRFRIENIEVDDNADAINEKH